jgi:hypothetical protein
VTDLLKLESGVPRGIELVNKAANDIDKVVRQNASSAEESASASDGMNSLAERMKDLPDELATVVTGLSGPSHRRGRRIRKGRENEGKTCSGWNRQCAEKNRKERY